MKTATVVIDVEKSDRPEISFEGEWIAREITATQKELIRAYRRYRNSQRKALEASEGDKDA